MDIPHHQLCGKMTGTSSGMLGSLRKQIQNHKLVYLSMKHKQFKFSLKQLQILTIKLAER